MPIEDLLGSDRESSAARQLPGVVVAIVTNNHDEEEMGRLKVRFPWRAEPEETYWVRIATMMAGKERGSVFYPEVGDEVLVAFDRGDVDKPFIIGALWNGKDLPPEVNKNGRNDIRKITSRSGHEFIFDDNATDKKEKIIIHTNYGHTVTMDDTDKKEKIEIKTTAGHKVVLDDTAGKEKIEIIDKTGSNKMIIDSVKNNINIECAAKMVIKANIIEIEGTTSVSVKSTKVDVEGSATCNVKTAALTTEGSATATHKAGGIMTVQGALVKIN
ncbi:MAG: phage tail protein [bacterium]|nr:phage tail protein [bacterium]